MMALRHDGAFAFVNSTNPQRHDDMMTLRHDDMMER